MLLANVYAGFIRFLLGVLFIWGGTSFAGLPFHVHGAWATQVCQAQDTPIGRRSVVTVALEFTGFFLNALEILEMVMMK